MQVYFVPIQGVSNLLWALGRIGLCYESVSISFLRTLLNQLSVVSLSMTDQAVSNTLLGLNGMTMRWQRFDVMY